MDSLIAMVTSSQQTARALPSFNSTAVQEFQPCPVSLSLSFFSLKDDWPFVPPTAPHTVFAEWFQAHGKSVAKENERVKESNQGRRQFGKEGHGQYKSLVIQGPLGIARTCQECRNGKKGNPKGSNIKQPPIRRFFGPRKRRLSDGVFSQFVFYFDDFEENGDHARNNNDPKENDTSFRRERQ